MADMHWRCPTCRQAWDHDPEGRQHWPADLCEGKPYPYYELRPGEPLERIAMLLRSIDLLVAQVDSRAIFDPRGDRWVPEAMSPALIVARKSEQGKGDAGKTLRAPAPKGSES